MIREFIVNLILNNLEILMIYILICSFTCERLNLNTKKVVAGLIWGSISGVFVSFISISIFKLVFYIVFFIMIKLITKYSISDVIILFELISFIILVVGIFIFMSIQMLQLNIYIEAILAQVLTTFAIYWIGRLRLYVLVRVVEKQIIMKLVLFCSTITLILIFFREYESIKSYCFIIVLASIFGIIYSMKDIYFFTTKYPEIYHEMRNMIAGIFFITQNVDPELQKELQGYYDVLGFDVKAVSNVDIDTKEPENKIKAFIDFKINNSKKYINIDTDIRYYENNISVPVSSIIYMLGILLDNAIDASHTDDIINVYIQCAEYNLDVEVSNKCEDMDELFKVFENNKSTKSIYRGYGIPNLKKMVKNYKGKMLVKKEYERAIITILIRN